MELDIKIYFIINLLIYPLLYIYRSEFEFKHGISMIPI